MTITLKCFVLFRSGPCNACTSCLSWTSRDAQIRCIIHPPIRVEKWNPFVTAL